MNSDITADYQRRKDAYLALLDLDAAARAERLAQFDREDPALAAALRAQLAAAGHAVPLLDQRSAEAAPPRVGAYTLLRELGRGGMGRVWLA